MQSYPGGDAEGGGYVFEPRKKRRHMGYGIVRTYVLKYARLGCYVRSQQKNNAGNQTYELPLSCCLIVPPLKCYQRYRC